MTAWAPDGWIFLRDVSMTYGSGVGKGFALQCKACGKESLVLLSSIRAKFQKNERLWCKACLSEAKKKRKKTRKPPDRTVLRPRFNFDDFCKER